MYGHSHQSGYRLADKLRHEYRDRGANLQGIRAASTEELVARAQMGRDPRENVSEEAFSDRLRNRDFTYNKSSYTPYRGNPGVRRSAGEPPRLTRSNEKGPVRNSTRKNGEKKRPRIAGMFREFIRNIKGGYGTGEVQVKTKRLSVGFLVTLAVVTTMIMTILFSVSQIYQTTNNIADLERQLNDLQTTAAELELAIEEKNDIRVIEQIATDQLGMVKEDSVQRKYISLSDGERIDLVGEEETLADGAFGTMLSSLFAALTGFFESFGS
ncbi:MAG: septum formation initiator family protein [Clostridia bacterium]|nr:septum formation initiator family protein [Clostridia bacterium]